MVAIFSQIPQGYEDALHVSAHLAPGPGTARSRKRPSAGQLAFQQFVREQLETGCLMSIALALIHPEQYALTRASIECMTRIRHVGPRAREWGFGFNVLTVVANRMSVLHRDRLSGGHLFLDCLLSVGGDEGTVLELPGLGIRAQYASGTMALFSGNTHLHGVSKSNAERVCFAAYVRKSVLQLFRLHMPDLPTTERAHHHLYWLTYINELIRWARK